MPKIIVITGTPCTGKTTVSEKLAKRIKNSLLIKANELVKEKRLFTGRSRNGELIANMAKLKSEIAKSIKSSDADVVIIEGHLLCDMRIPGATAIVIRGHLKTLQKRMKARKYSRIKIENNTVSEAIDYCGVNAAENYMSVHEIMGGDGAVDEIIGIINGKRAARRDIDMLAELNGLMEKNRRYLK